MPKPVASANDSAAAPSRADIDFDLNETFHHLNQRFGEVLDGKVLGRDDYITDPEQLAQFPRPTEEEIRLQVLQGFAAAPPGEKS